MKYRKYYRQIKITASLAAAFTLVGCASTQKEGREPDSVQTEQSDGQSPNRADRPSRFDGREPSSMKGNFTWLNEVEEDFGRIAAETSSRAVASQNKHDVLMKQKEWSFSYLPKTNHFYVDLQGSQYRMVQTKIDDGERFAFAAEGQAENPVTFAVTKREGRSVASGAACAVEISYWSKRAKSYVTDRQTLEGKRCERVLKLLKDYVP